MQAHSPPPATAPLDRRREEPLRAVAESAESQPRAAAPGAHDGVRGTRLGVHAARLAHEGRFGQMVSLRGTRITSVELSDAVGKMRTLEPEFMTEAREFFT